jgi:hypothetical protein
MNTFKVFIFLAIMAFTSQKCELVFKTVGYSNAFYSLIQCTPGYKELYSYNNLHPELIGFPKAAQNAKVDLKIIGLFKGHVTVTSIEDDYIEFYTNQHLVFMDIPWMMLLMLLIVLCMCIASPYITRTDVLKGSILFYLLCSYYSPLFGYSPFFRSFTSPHLSACSVIDEPQFGLEFSFKGILDKEHFTATNDWVKLKCPIDLKNLEFDEIRSSNLQDLIRVQSENTPDTLRIIHNATKDWIKDRSLDTIHIANKTAEILKTHYKVWEEIQSVCLNSPCMWEGNIVDSNDYYIVVNSTMLPGHSGLPCRSNFNDTTFHGIVQGYHPGRGFNICSRLSKTRPSEHWILFIILPLLFCKTIKLLLRKKTRKNGALMSLVMILIISVLTDLIYF